MTCERWHLAHYHFQAERLTSSSTRDVRTPSGERPTRGLGPGTSRTSVTDARLRHGELHGSPDSRARDRRQLASPHVGGFAEGRAARQLGPPLPTPLLCYGLRSSCARFRGRSHESQGPLSQGPGPHRFGGGEKPSLGSGRVRVLRDCGLSLARARGRHSRGSGCRCSKSRLTSSGSEPLKFRISPYQERHAT